MLDWFLCPAALRMPENHSSCFGETSSVTRTARVWVRGFVLAARTPSSRPTAVDLGCACWAVHALDAIPKNRLGCCHDGLFHQGRQIPLRRASSRLILFHVRLEAQRRFVALTTTVILPQPLVLVCPVMPGGCVVGAQLNSLRIGSIAAATAKVRERERPEWKPEKLGCNWAARSKSASAAAGSRAMR